MLLAEYNTSIATPHQLQLVSLAPTASYTVNGNLDLSVTATAGEVWNTATGFVPIGFATSGGNASPTAFTGTLNGQTHSISNLAITISGNANLGLISEIGSGGRVENLFVSGSVTAGASQSYLGILAGQNAGTMSGVGVAGTASAGAAPSYEGGLVGSNASGATLLQDFASVAVNGGSGAHYLGGLAGANAGTISQSYATGSVFGGSSASAVAGLAGSNSGSVLQSYAIGLVSGGNGASGVGGLVGSGAGSVSAGYWDTSLSNQTASSGGSGLTATGWAGLSADSAWSSGWTFIAGHSFPMLGAFPYVAVTLSAGSSASWTYGQTAPAVTASIGAASDSSGAGSTSGLVYPAVGHMFPAGSGKLGVTGLVAAGYQIDFQPVGNHHDGYVRHLDSRFGHTTAYGHHHFRGNPVEQRRAAIQSLDNRQNRPRCCI